MTADALANRLSIAEEAEEAGIDPVTFEVLRHRLWAINEEHGTTLLRMSGSPTAIYAQDFNPGILTPDGEWVYFGPYVQFINAGADAGVRWINRHRADNPGIHPGDIFITNDPWVGTIHQQDVVVLAPVFVDDELFCWVSNTLHMYDLGGLTPGSYCPAAKDVYDEATMFPPMKIQEGGEVRRDVQEAWLRQSRMPELVALDLNGLMAGCNVARSRIEDVCERYGAVTVRAAMNRILLNAEKAFVHRLSGIPDGTWRERSYIEVAGPGDRNVYANVLTITKRGTELTFTNEGSAPQVGSINSTGNAWKGAIMAALNPPFLYDQLYAIGGALRHCHFEPEPRLINSAEYPMAVSNSSPCMMLNTIAVANNCLGRMLATSPETKTKLLVSGAMSSQAVDIFSGRNQRGEPFGMCPMDNFLGGISGSAVRDGIDNGGNAWGPKGTAPNVEHNEQSMPVLYLWRRELVDSGGPGRFRGGNSSSLAMIPHRTDRITHDITGWGMAAPTSSGLFGGQPSGPNRVIFVRDSNVRALRAEGRLPGGPEDLEGAWEHAHQRHESLPQGPDDVWLYWWCAGAGYGDPLDRPAADVLADVVAGRISRERAERDHGVILAGGPDDPSVDEAATRAERERRRSRFAGAGGD